MKSNHEIISRTRAEDAQSALFDFTDRLFRSITTAEVYEAALDAITRALGCQRASILLFDEAGVMKFVAWRGLSVGYRQAVDGHSPWTPDSQDPQPITIADVASAELDATLKATIRAEGIAALAFIPLATRGVVIGKFMTYHLNPYVFSEADVNVAVTIARQLGFALERMKAEEQRRRAEEAKELLLKESCHRIRNTLATVRAIAGQTLRKSDPGEVQAFLARLHALGEAHELLTIESWHQAPLSEVVDRALKPFAQRQESIIIMHGPSAWIPANTAMSLTLCLHELATNASKYGALSNDTGKVELSWDLDHQGQGRTLRLMWQEAGGPPVRPSGRRGFGSLLIESTGKVGTRMDFRPAGITCQLHLPL